MLYDGVEFVVFDLIVCDDIFSAELIVTRDSDDSDDSDGDDDDDDDEDTVAVYWRARD
jgi:hypothetical protein